MPNAIKLATLLVLSIATSAWAQPEPTPPVILPNISPPSEPPEAPAPPPTGKVEVAPVAPAEQACPPLRPKVVYDKPGKGMRVAGITFITLGVAGFLAGTALAVWAAYHPINPFSENGYDSQDRKMAIIGGATTAGIAGGLAITGLALDIAGHRRDAAATERRARLNISPAGVQVAGTFR